MKVYLASSWKNERIVLELQKNLRKKGFEVDAFCNPDGRFVFNIHELTPDILSLNPKTFLEYEKTQKAFQEDRKFIEWCDVLIMIQPCGNSSHLEAGYAKGRGKIVIIYYPDFFPEKGGLDVMYGFADLITDVISELISYLKQLGPVSANVEKPITKSKTIYLVWGQSGEHEDRSEWVVAAYADKTLAEQRASDAQAEVKKFLEEWSAEEERSFKTLAEQRASDAQAEVKKFLEEWSAEEERSFEKLDAFKNQYDPNMVMDTGGVRYGVQEVELIENERRE